MGVGFTWCQTQKSSSVLCDPSISTQLSSTYVTSGGRSNFREFLDRRRTETTLLCLGQDFSVSCNWQQATTGSSDFHWERRFQQLPTQCTVSGRRAARADLGSNMAFHDIRAKTLDGQVVSMEKYKGKVVLVENTASLWGTTVRDFTQMNELCEKVILCQKVKAVE